LRLAKLKMHLTSANVWYLAAVNTPIDRLPCKMPSQRSSDGAYDKKGFDPWALVAVLWFLGLLIWDLYGPH